MNSQQDSSSQHPSIERCLALMEDFGMYQNIRRHSCMVARTAEILYRGLVNAAKAAPLPDRQLVIAGALLHDIAKTKCLEEGCRHAEVGRDICNDLGLPFIAEIVANHVTIADFKDEEYRQGKFGAIELVFYADKRVNHDQVVSLDERLAYILDKYSQNKAVRKAHILKNFEQCRTIERHIFAFVDFAPEDVRGLLNTSPQELLHYLPESQTL
ncbi:MAG: metal-dependent phosphohydrolase [Deltaproteobacteria bacterium]|nr:MAG: metal-dependent phosphohydrolase [Deltaproteobacteria bacterium]